eukprot:3304057-Alexandrium_andersonii.AAC.1
MGSSGHQRVTGCRGASRQADRRQGRMGRASWASGCGKQEGGRTASGRTTDEQTRVTPRQRHNAPSTG